MKLERISVSIPHSQFDDFEINVPTIASISEVTAEDPKQFLENAISSGLLRPERPKYTLFDENFFYLVFSDFLTIKRSNKEDTVIPCDYQSANFVNYIDRFEDFYNRPATAFANKDTKFLSFLVKDTPFSEISVKALTISNSSVSINTSNDSIVIIVGSHDTGLVHPGSATNPARHYRIMNDGSANTYAPGVMTISTNQVCHVVTVEKNT